MDKRKLDAAVFGTDDLEELSKRLAAVDEGPRMHVEYVPVMMLPVDLCMLNTCVKVTGLSRSDIVRHFMHRGLEARKDLPIVTLRAEVLESEAKVLGYQVAIDQTGGRYKLEK